MTRAIPTLSLRLGLRREIVVLMPVALLLLILLSTYTLFAYRNGLKLLLDERRNEAARLAQRLAAGLTTGPLPSAEALRLQAPQARRLALVDEKGRAVVESGDFPLRDLLAPFAGLALDATRSTGPGEGIPDSVAGLAPLTRSRQRFYVRVDLREHHLAARWRGLRVLTWLVTLVNVGVAVLLLFFLRHVLAPYESLLERARRAQPGHDESQDEVSFLVETFERALEALNRPVEPAEDDLAALQRTLGPSLASGLLLVDRQERVLSLNPVGAGLLGVAVPGESAELASALAPHAEIVTTIQSAIRGDSSAAQRREIEIERDGETRTLGLTVHPLRRDDGTVRASLVLFADLTETRRQAEDERLGTSLAQLGELSAGLAHEQRNSLATLRGYLTLIERAPDEESITDYLEEIRRESDHLQRVLEDFLSFARPGSVRLEEVDLVGIARRAALDPALEGFPVEVESEGEEEAIIKGDAQLLERAVRNLLHNAAEAERGAGLAGPVRVRLRASTEGLAVVIEDRGPGVPPEVRKRLFQPFATGRQGGVGLGLALARRIVDLHRGKLSLEARAEGGTRATIWIPASRAARPMVT